MGSVTWRSSAVVQGPPEEVYAWMSDFTKDDHNSDAYRRGSGAKPGKKEKPSVRTILSREGNVLRIRDQWNGDDWTQTVTLDPARRSVRIQGDFGYDALWTAAAEGAGTRLTVEGAMGKGLLGSLAKLFQGKMRRSMEADFQGHLEDLRETLKSK